MTVKKHKDAIKNIRTTLKALLLEKPRLRAEIRALKFGPNNERRPETGPTRHSMKQAYNWNVRPEVRATLLAYGLLRGMPYSKMEPKAESGIHLSRVLRAIHTAIGDNEELKAEWTSDRIAKLIFEGVDPLAASEAA
jgi:hypothetical protein